MILLLALLAALLFVTASAVSDRDNEKAEATQPMVSTTVYILSTDAPTPTVSVKPESKRYILTEDVPLPLELQRVMQDACEESPWRS